MDFGKGIDKSFDIDYSHIVDDDDDAVVLIDEGNFSFVILAEKITLKEEYHQRFRVLKPKGAENANIKIRFQHENRYQNVADIKASSYTNTNGKIEEHKLNKRDIFEKELDDRYSEISFAIPNVKEGSIFEYSFTLYSKNKYKPSTWYFNGTNPVLYSQIAFKIPEKFSYFNYFVGTKEFDVNLEEPIETDYGAQYKRDPSIRHTWGMKDLPAFKNEKYVANINDFKEQIQFRLNYIDLPSGREVFNTTWDKLNKNLLENDYSDQQKDKKLINDQVNQLVSGIGDEKEKIKTLFDFVVNSIDVEHDGWVYTSKPVKQVLKNKKGNLADANLLLVNMLQSAGFDAYPMLISTRSDGYIDKNYPSLNSFSYPVAYINMDNEHLVMNASSKWRPYYLPRYNDYNLYGWVVDEKNPGWVDIEDLAPRSKRYIKVACKLNDDGSLSGNLELQSDNYLSVGDRTTIEEEGVKSRIEELYKDAGWTNEIKITNEAYGDLNDAYKTFSFSADFEVNEFAKKAGHYLYINPLLFFRQTENPFKKDARSFPIDYAYPQNYILSMQIDIPEGYHVDELPKPQIISLSDATKFSYQVKEQNNQLTIQLNDLTKETYFVPDNYASLKEYNQKIIDAMNQQITLVKE